MRPVCFASEDTGSVVIAAVMLLLALAGLAASVRLLVYSGAMVDRRFLGTSRAQRAITGAFGLLVSSAMTALMLYYLVARPICG